MVTLERDRLVFRAPQVDPAVRLSVSFQRTLRVPDDGREYPLPAGFGRFPVRHVEDFGHRLPPEIRRRGGVILPMHQAEALWIHFEGEWPVAVQVGTGKICAITGERWTDGLRRDPEQNYVVVPEQPWLDGYAMAKGQVRQFVAMPLGQGYTVEEQLTGEGEWGGIQLQAFPLRKEVMPVGSPDVMPMEADVCYSAALPSPMGLAPGGRITQEIYEDERPLPHWDQLFGSRVFVHLLNSLDWARVTGEAAPSTPITLEAYRKAGIPWFDHYREDLSAVPGGSGLKGIKSLGQMGGLDDDGPGLIIHTGPGKRPREVSQGSSWE
jgi:hypothetical protein